MKNNNKMKNKNEQQKPTSQIPPRGSPKQSTITGVFWSSKAPIKKKDYRSVIDITFISDIVFHMVAISTFNKGNG